MALRTKTIEYAFPISTASVGAGSARDFTGITIYIPETPTFRSVVLEVSCYDNTGTAASVTSVLMGISLGAVARNDVTVTQTITNSGENQGLIFTRDVTAYFTTNWTGTNMTSGCRLTIGGMSTGVATAKLIITYQYDDTGQTTRVKTVRIPIDGNTGALTTSLANVGGVADQIPNLDTWLPEATKVYRDIFFESYMHTGKTTGTTDRALNMRFNGTNTLSVTYEAALISDFMIKRIDKILGNITTNQTNDVEASTANTDMPFTCLSGMLVVTYEYDHSTSTRVMNSIMLPSLDESGWVGGPATGDKSRFTRRIYVEEPGTITLEQSALLVSMIDDAAMTLDLRIGSQNSRTFAHTATVRCGSVYQMRRFDSGAAGTSSGVSLSRGVNDVVIDYFTTGTAAGTLGSNINGVMILNYSSDIHPDGDGAHNHTTFWVNRPWTAGLTQRTQYSPATVPDIPETDYYVTSIGYEAKFITTAAATVSNMSLCLLGEVQSGEADGAGWYSFYDSIYSNDNEIGTSVIWARARDEYKRYPQDPDSSRLGVETSRDYRIDINPNGGFLQVIKMITYHDIIFPIAGTITGGNGVDNIIVRVFRTDNDELIQEVIADSTDGNLTGTFNVTWYDDTIDVIAVAYQDSTYKGVSLKQIASSTNTFDIDLSSTGGGEYSFGFA
jgi:hypothetical protein